MDNFTRVSNNVQLQLQHQLTKPQQTESQGFAEALKKELEKSGSVKFSKHAMERIRSRGVEMSPQMMESLN